LLGSSGSTYLFCCICINITICFNKCCSRCTNEAFGRNKYFSFFFKKILNFENINKKKDSNKMAAELEEMDREINKRLDEKENIEERARLRNDTTINININKIKDSSILEKQVN
jgi:hypothetical protein